MTLKWRGEGSWNQADFSNMLQEIKVTSASTSITFTGLDSSVHGGYVLVVDMINNATANSDYYLFVNNDTTLANYNDQYRQIIGNTFSGGSGSTSRFVFCPANGGYSKTLIDISILTNGIFSYISNNFRSDLTLQDFAGKKIATIPKITSLTITAQTANAIGVGSNFRLYKRKVDSSLVTGTKQNSGWIAPTLLNGWTNFGGSFETMAYMQDEMGYVIVKGFVKPGGFGSSSPIFILPQGYRPLKDHNETSCSWGNNTLYPCRSCVDSTGKVYIDGNGVDWLVVSMRFKAEQ